LENFSNRQRIEKEFIRSEIIYQRQNEEEEGLMESKHRQLINNLLDSLKL
jgi:hypothetical protein